MPGPKKFKLTPRQERMIAHHRQMQLRKAKLRSKKTKSPESTIDSLESVYRALRGNCESGDRAGLLLKLRSWLTEISDFDPVTGQALPTTLVDLANAIEKDRERDENDGELKDRVYRIACHVKEAVGAISENMRHKILREHAMVPIYAAREIDGTCVQWLSRRPGRTIREKVSGKPYVKAVRRRTSLDTSENRLLKAFLSRFEQILVERQFALEAESEKTCEEFLAFLHRWSRSQAAAEIGTWGNLPPNNTLLQDKFYRKAWDGWIWCQSVDESICADCKRIKKDLLTVIYWNFISMLHQTARFRTVQQPLDIDYENFSINAASPASGYVFAAQDSFLTGKIKFFNKEKEFGFISTKTGDFYFNKSNLAKGVECERLESGEAVVFEIGRNSQGECAENVDFVQSPQKIATFFENERIEVDFDEMEIMVEIEEDHIATTQLPSGEKKRFGLTLQSSGDVASFMLSTILNGSTSFSGKKRKHGAGPVHSDGFFIDLCSIRPKFAARTGSVKTLPFRLLQQHWPINANEDAMIDCGEARAIRLDQEIKNVSMRSVLSTDFGFGDALKSSASMFFTAKLKEYIPAASLTYLVPDWINEFDLECIRKSVNFHYDSSTPVPKSIAAIFSWQSSGEFEPAGIGNEDCVLVLDAIDGGWALTPVQAVFATELAAILPETKGLYWERHPALIVDDKSFSKNVSETLSRQGCKNAEELIQLFGIDGLIDDAGDISFVESDEWYHLSTDLEAAFSNGVVIDNLAGNCRKSIEAISKRPSKGNVFLLAANSLINRPGELGEFKWIDTEPSLVDGARALAKWQKKAGKTPLWRDHLPELSARIPRRDGRFDSFYLVKDATITPKRGRKISIPVKEKFTLMASNRTHYRFPLQQGDGNRELLYVAYLKSPAFPLKSNVECELHMTYTYGADNPYDLEFRPLEPAKAGFRSVRVQWLSVSEEESGGKSSFPVPIFPLKKTWADFRNFPKEDGTKNDLLDWCGSKLAVLDGLVDTDEQKTLRDLAAGRNTGHFEWGGLDKNEKYFCKVDVDGESVFCHSSKFIEKIDTDSLSKGCKVYLDVDYNEMGGVGSNVSFQERVPEKLRKQYEEERLRIAERGMNSLRFPVLTIWSNGHSISEPETPKEFKNSIIAGRKAALSIWKSGNYSNGLKKEALFFLSCLHEDTPSEISRSLVDASENEDLFRRYSRNIGFAIGTARLPWQKRLLENTLEYVEYKGLTCSIALEILSIAFWRAQELVFHSLVGPQAETLVGSLYQCLEHDCKRISNNVMRHRLKYHLDEGLAENEAIEKERRYQTENLTRHLELLLALLRIRNEGEMKRLLSPAKKIVRKYTLLIDEIEKAIKERNIELRCRIGLQIEKHELFQSTPDLIYALRKYLTGDPGASTIVITGVSDPE